MILGIDATNARLGGGVTYLSELLNNIENAEIPFEKIIIWGNLALKDKLKSNERIAYHVVSEIDKGFIRSSIWKMFAFPKLLKGRVDLLFSPGGVYFSRKIKYVSMSQNMLVFDDVERRRFSRFNFMRIKLKALGFFQKRSFLNAKGMIFISSYARNFIKRKIGYTCKDALIRHGISPRFDSKPRAQKDINEYSFENPYTLLYVSILYEYKHHVNLVKAVASLRQMGYPIQLELVGGAYHKPSYSKLKEALSAISNSNDFIRYHGEIAHEKIAEFYKKADAFVYASSCENMPNIIIEAMRAGLPIISSNYNPMPEFMNDSAFYFDPLDINDISNVIEDAILKPTQRARYADELYLRSFDYSWKKCARETVNFLFTIANEK